MPLPAGAKLGPYQIQSPLGAGGMGEVYKAKDTRLDRTVAIKILAAHLSSSSEIKQRFEREARTVSSLNHPHICQLYDVGSQDGTEYLVMEFLEGETLADRLRKGALPLGEFLKISTEVAEGLAVAHRAGIVHRDLKPGNIMLTKSGAKLMDFGLAKPTVPGASGSSAAPLLSDAHTTSMASPMASPGSPLTTVGSIVGTILYMSPEQIEGKEADARSDIFSFGAVMYEMATGQRAFDGKSQITVASAILEKDPEPIRAKNPAMPAAVEYLVTTCLAKDRDERFQSAQDVRLQLKGISAAPSSTSGTVSVAAVSVPPAVTGPNWKLYASLGALALLLAGEGLANIFFPRASSPALSVRAYIPPPPGTSFRISGGLDVGPAAISPDGKTLAFTAVDEKGVTQLWTRPLGSVDATALAGTSDASFPFWSPDGQYLAYSADGKLMKIRATGGDAQTLAEGLGTETGRGAWNADGTILFCKDYSGPIYSVSAGGGTMKAETRLAKNEAAHDEPSFLPDGKHFLYSTRISPQEGKIKIGELGKIDQTAIEIGAGGGPKYADGHLLFIRGSHIQAQAFDAKTWKLSGDPEDLGKAGYFSVSTNGVLAYNEGSEESELKLYDRSGNAIAKLGAESMYSTPRFSPDGQSIAIAIDDAHSGKHDIWIFPAAGGQPDRFTFGPDDSFPVWSPDGKELVYEARDDGKYSLRRRSLDGHTPEQVIYAEDVHWRYLPIDWSPDGKFLSLHMIDKDGLFSNWVLPMTVPNAKPFRPSATADLKVSEYEGRFSADSHRICYFAYETGRPEVFVVPFPGGGVKSQISTTGGWLARFSRNEIYYATLGNDLMASTIHTDAGFHADPVRRLFHLDFPNVISSFPLYDVSADGQRFAVLSVDRTRSSSITLVTNWPAQLKK
jgi:eukaryotic-like serine/threonine-protein kinase